jgi:flagellar hook-associated protein 2
MAVSSTNFVSALGTGSGIDIKALAQSLVDAERKPKQELIQVSIDKSKSKVSGYTATQLAVNELQKAFDGLKSESDFRSFKLSNSQPSAVTASVAGAARTGGYEIAVTQVAQGQRSVSSAFSTGQALHTGPFDVSIRVGTGTTTTVRVNTPTPEGLVSAINAANLTVTASIVNTGDPTTPNRVVLTGPTGAANSFTVTSTATTALGYVTPVNPQTVQLPERAAANAMFSVDGIAMQRASNQVSDAITGLTLNLSAPTTGAAVLSVSQDTAPVKEKIKAIVTAYNDLQEILDAALNKDSKVESIGGSLVGDSTIRNIRSQVRDIVMPSVASGGGVSHLRDLGLFIDSDGRMKFSSFVEGTATSAPQRRIGDESDLDKALATRFSEVVQLFAGSATDGFAKTASDRLSGSGMYVDSVVSPSSPKKLLLSLVQGASQRIVNDNSRMADLQRRMETLLERYTKQFAIMDTLVGESRSTRSSVENSFKGMSASR